MFLLIDFHVTAPVTNKLQISWCVYTCTALVCSDLDSRPWDWGAARLLCDFSQYHNTTNTLPHNIIANEPAEQPINW